MLKIRDKNGKTRFIWNDEDEEPLSIDELILNDEKEKKEKDNGKSTRH